MDVVSRWRNVVLTHDSLGPCIPYSGYFSRGNIFVVFVVERRTTKYLHTKKRESKRDHASVIMLLARAVFVSERRFRAEYCTRGAVLRVEVSYGLISLL